MNKALIESGKLGGAYKGREKKTKIRATTSNNKKLLSKPPRKDVLTLARTRERGENTRRRERDSKHRPALP